MGTRLTIRVFRVHQTLATSVSPIIGCITSLLWFQHGQFVASISLRHPRILGYHHDLDESFIRLLNDTQRLGQREVEEF